MSLRKVGTGLSALGLSLALGLSVQAAEKQITTPVPQIDPADIAAGYCKGATGDIPMREVLFLENRSVDWKTPQGTVRVWLDRDVLHTSDPADPSGGTTFVGINYLIKGDVDIVLKLAIYDGQLLVYWRETFEHREYRQGLFQLPAEGDPRPLCEGKAGHWQSH